MSYCTTSDVQTLLAPVNFTIGQTDADGSVDEPNNTTINSILIPAADGMIDSQLRGLYAVPISNSTDVQVLRFIAMQFVAARCAEYLMGGRADPEANTVLLEHRTRAQAELDMITSGRQKLLTARSSFVDDGIHGLFTPEVTANYTAKTSIDQKF